MSQCWLAANTECVVWGERGSGSWDGKLVVVGWVRPRLASSGGQRQRYEAGRAPVSGHWGSGGEHVRPCQIRPVPGAPAGVATVSLTHPDTTVTMWALSEQEWAGSTLDIVTLQCFSFCQPQSRNLLSIYFKACTIISCWKSRRGHEFEINYGCILNNH